MLNGLDPVLVFQLYKLIPSTQAALANIPIATRAKEKATFAIIPLYLSAELTGVFIDDESKNIDINTEPSSLATGEAGSVDQKTLGSITTINLIAKRESVGLTILLALSELLLDKTTSQEYEITYIHGPITVFGGLLHGFSYETGSSDDLLKIKVELSRGRPKVTAVQVEQNPNAVRLSSEGPIPPPNAPTTSGTSGGGSQISPRIGGAGT